MDTEEQSIKLDIQNWKFRIDERSRNRMKINIKLSKDEAEAYKNFATSIKPDQINDNDFMKTIFFKGCEKLHTELQELTQRFAKENKEELASSGIAVVEGENGDVKLMTAKKSESQENVEEA